MFSRVGEILYPVAKASADAMLEAAIDALKQSLASRATTPAEIDRMARVCRVQAIIRPYLEALA